MGGFMAKYKRATLYPCKRNIGFTAEMDTALNTIADRDSKSVADVVRECVEMQLPKVSDRRRKKR